MFFSPKQSLTRMKFFFSRFNDSVHSELYSFPPTLTYVLRGCVRDWSNSKKSLYLWQYFGHLQYTNYFSLRRRAFSNNVKTSE